MGLMLWVVPLLMLSAAAVSKNLKVIHKASVAASALLVVLAGTAAREVWQHGSLSYQALGGVFYLDALSVIVLNIVTWISLMASVYSIGYIDAELSHGKLEGRRVKLYYLLMYSFIFTMILALTVKNMGIMWIAIEATTLATAFLVGFYNDKQALEGAWKYVMICSVGIAVAFLGIVFLHLSSIGVLSDGSVLDWTALYEQADRLKSPVLRLAFIFIVIGFGTKAGLAPMHTWLPDAHSQAPSPISALLSGVLLNTAMYGIIRTVAIVNKNLSDNMYAGRVLIAFGFLSILTAALFILTQKDYKRLLAYSSIEHMGIIALGVGLFTPASIFAALLHMINHSLTKSMLFLSSGTVMQKYGTKEIRKVRNLLKLLPVTGPVFLVGIFAIAGTPPFSVFASEFNMMAALFAGDHFILGALFIVLLALVFVGIAVTLFKMFYGNGEPPELEAGEHNRPGAGALLILLVMTAVMGFYLPGPLKELIVAAQKLIAGAF